MGSHCMQAVVTPITVILHCLKHVREQLAPCKAAEVASKINSKVFALKINIKKQKLYLNVHQALMMKVMPSYWKTRTHSGF